MVAESHVDRNCPRKEKNGKLKNKRVDKARLQDTYVSLFAQVGD